MLERAERYLLQPHELAQACMPWKGIGQAAEKKFNKRSFSSQSILGMVLLFH